MQFKFPVEDASQVSEARRECVAIAERAGFGEDDAGRVALATMEFATNLLKHASGGFLVAGLIEFPAETAAAIQLMSMIEVVLANGRILRIGADIDMAVLKRIAAALEDQA